MQFCLNLPQSSYNSSSKITTEIDIPSEGTITPATVSMPVKGTDLASFFSIAYPTTSGSAPSFSSALSIKTLSADIAIPSTPNMS